MRSVPLTLSILLCSILSASASEIREFDLKTAERLGEELTRVVQTPDKGASTAARKRARESAIAALQGKLFKIHYDYVVLDDPDGSGFLVYALGSSRKRDEAVLAGHFRVSVSSDGQTVKRIDALSRSLTVVPAQPPGPKTAGLWIIQLVSDQPVETFIYLSNLHHAPIFVGTPDRTIWKVEQGKMKIIRDKKDAPAH